jgi:hypothetical protein
VLLALFLLGAIALLASLTPGFGEANHGERASERD